MPPINQKLHVNVMIGDGEKHAWRYPVREGIVAKDLEASSLTTSN
jgi:hypothetical protein